MTATVETANGKVAASGQMAGASGMDAGVEPSPPAITLPALPHGSSPGIANVAAALAKAQGAMQHALKDAENPHFKSKYADLASVIDACRAALAANGIAIHQVTYDADNGVIVNTMLLHESGEWLDSGPVFVPVAKGDAQGHGSAYTYARRYSLSLAVGIAQDDDDGNAAASAKPDNTASAARTGRAPSQAATKLTKTQSDKLVKTLMEGGMAEGAAKTAAAATTRDVFDRALAKAQRLVDEQAAAPPADPVTCGECEGTGRDAGDDEQPCGNCAGTGAVAA